MKIHIEVLLFLQHTEPQDVLGKQMVYMGKSEQIQSKFYPQKGCLPVRRPNIGNWVLGPEMPVSVDFEHEKEKYKFNKVRSFLWYSVSTF